MHVGILPQVDARQVEAEDIDRAAQAAQPAAGELRRTVGSQRMMQDVEVATEPAASA